MHRQILDFTRRRARVASSPSFPALDFYQITLLLLILSYTVVFTWLAFDQHAGMRTHRKDLGNIDAAIWNSSRGDFLQAVKGDEMSIRLTDHVEPIFVLISPIFWLWDDVRALLLFQVVAVAVGAIPLYALALEKFNQLLSAEDRGRIWRREPVEGLTRPLALALAVAYLLAPPLQAAILTEFHAIPLAVPLILWAFWAVEKQRWAQFAVAALLVTAVKEEAALLGAGLGVWALWRIVRNRGTDRPRFALLLSTSVTLLSLLWFYIATFVIVPAYATNVYEVAESGYFQRYGALGDSPADIFLSFFTQPALVWQIATEPVRAGYLFGLLAVFGFLGLLAPEIMVLCLPVLLANLLSAYPAQYYGEFHYSAPLVPYMAVAAAYGMGRLWRFLARRAARRSEAFQHLPAASAPVMALVSVFTNAQLVLRPLIAAVLVLWLLACAGWRYGEAGLGPGGGRYSPAPVTDHHRLLPRFTAQIPAQAAVSATAAVHPHVSHRRFIYQFPLGVEPVERADWALLDVTTNTDMAPGDLKATVERMLAGGWGVVDAAGGFLLLHKGAGEKTIPDAFYDFARADGDRVISSSAPIGFGPLTLHSVELEDWSNWRQTKITTLWRVEEGFVPGSVRPWLAVRTPDAETLYTYTESAPPALVWYPPERWQPGELIQIQTLWLFLPRHWGLAAGAVHGPDALVAGHRLPVAENPGAHLVDETGTLALAAAFSRQADGALVALPTTPGHLRDSAAQAGQQTVSEIHGMFGLARQISVTAWLPETAAAGQRLDLGLRWQTEEASLLEAYHPFVHLRRDSEIIGQSDGPPRYFLPLPAGAPLVDWRQFSLPADLPPGEVAIYIGLYDPLSGERLTAFDAGAHPTGNELFLGRVRIEPPLAPDQACALVSPACASQGR